MQPQTILWSDIQNESDNCPEYKTLFEALKNDQHDAFLTPPLQAYQKVRSALTLLDGLVMLNNRIVVPKRFRQVVLDFLHVGHAGTQAMISRAVQSFYWPGFRDDIAQTRNACSTCNECAPSNPTLPLIMEPDLPSYPFHMVSSDFLKAEWTFLLIVRSVIKLQCDNSTHLIQALRS